jgi:hypothetical protein
MFVRVDDLALVSRKNLDRGANGLVPQKSEFDNISSQNNLSPKYDSHMPREMIANSNRHRNFGKKP